MLSSSWQSGMAMLRKMHQKLQKSLKLFLAHFGGGGGGGGVKILSPLALSSHIFCMHLWLRPLSHFSPIHGK